MGANYDALHEQRKGFNNFSGARQGVIGDVRRDEANRVFNFDQYAQGETRLAERWAMTLGIRNSRVAFRSDDRFTANGNDSGSVVYGNTMSTAGLLYQPHETLSLYANLGKGVETPTFNELAYRLGAQGLNLDLRNARSIQAELGAKMRLGQSNRLNLAVFNIDTRNDLAVLQNAGGRAVYQNVDKTERRGFELAFDSALPYGLSALLAYTYLDANFAAPYVTCRPVTPCVFPDTNTATVPSGNALPGISKHTVYGELAWTSAAEHVSAALELRSVGRMYANDINTEYAPGYAAVNWRAQLKQQLGKVTLREFVRVDNLFDRQYVTSLIVNEANGRYYEPAPGLTFLIGASIVYVF